MSDVNHFMPSVSHFLIDMRGADTLMFIFCILSVWKQHMPRVLDEVWWAVAHKRLIKCWVTGTLIVYLLIDVCRKLLHCSFKYSIFFINYLKWNLSGMNLCLCEFEQHGCVCDETFLPSACRQYISYPNITHILDHL